jgi:hypothetical protein
MLHHCSTNYEDGIDGMLQTQKIDVGLLYNPSDGRRVLFSSQTQPNNL